LNPYGSPQVAAGTEASTELVREAAATTADPKLRIALETIAALHGWRARDALPGEESYHLPRSLKSSLVQSGTS